MSTPKPNPNDIKSIVENKIGVGPYGHIKLAVPDRNWKDPTACEPERIRHEKCFFTWYNDKFLQGSPTKIHCEPEWRAYQACTEKKLKELGLVTNTWEELESEIPSPEFFTKLDKKFGPFVKATEKEELPEPPKGFRPKPEKREEGKIPAWEVANKKYEGKGEEDFQISEYESIQDDIDISKEFKKATPAQTARRKAAFNSAVAKEIEEDELAKQGISVDEDEPKPKPKPKKKQNS